MILAEMGPDVVDQVSGVVLDLATGVTDEVELVVGMGLLPAGAAIGAELRFPDEVQLTEERQRPIDGGQIDRRVPGVDPGGDLLGREMAVYRREGVPDQSPGHGGTMTVLAQKGE